MCPPVFLEDSGEGTEVGWLVPWHEDPYPKDPTVIQPDLTTKLLGGKCEGGLKKDKVIMISSATTLRLLGVSTTSIPSLYRYHIHYYHILDILSHLSMTWMTIISPSLPSEHHAHLPYQYWYHLYHFFHCLYFPFSTRLFVT